MLFPQDMNTKIKMIFFVFILLFISEALCPQDRIEIFIDGDTYVAEYPKTLQEANSLIDSLVKINNETDSSFVEYQGVVNKEKEQLLIKLNALEKNNNTLSAQFDELNIKNTELNHLIDRYQRKSKNDLLLLSSIGPSFDILDNSIGIAITLGAIHRISVFNLFDFYAGLNINTNIYYQEARTKISDLGIGAVLGIFVK